MILFSILLTINTSADVGLFPAGFQATRKYLCNGKTPKYEPTYKVRFVMPKVTAGTDLAQAAEFKTFLYKAARTYVKESFFYDLSEKPTDKPASVSPIVDGLDKNAVQKQYSEMHFPAWVRKGGDSKLFYSIVFPNDRLALMVPRAFDFYLGDSFTHTDIGELGYYQVTRSPKIEFGNLRTANVFTIDTEKHLVPTYYGDLRELIQTYKMKDMDWQDYLEKNTVVQESMKDDGTILFLLKLDMEPFCIQGMAIKDTVTH